MTTSFSRSLFSSAAAILFAGLALCAALPVVPVA